MRTYRIYLDNDDDDESVVYIGFILAPTEENAIRRFLEEHPEYFPKRNLLICK